VNEASDDRFEIWLRGNVRPALAAAALAAFGAVGVTIAMIAAGRPAWLVWPAVAAVPVVGLLAAVGGTAARPRLARRGESLEIRLSPGRVERVPLQVVECVFRGTEPLDEWRPEPRCRVDTLVVRFAERAAEWRFREAFRPWGSWVDGHAVIDGRWCEPLSQPTVERIAAALVAAKRETAAKQVPS